MQDNLIKIDPEGREVTLQVIFLKEGAHVIAYAPALDLSAFGDTIEEAKEAFTEAVEIFIDDLVSRGTLSEVLEGLGWERGANAWIPPTIISHHSERIGIPLPH